MAARQDGFDGDLAMLERLGAAMLREWHRLPMPVQRRLYEAAARSDAGPSRPAARRALARFLHEHKRGRVRA